MPFSELVSDLVALQEPTSIDHWRADNQACKRKTRSRGVVSRDATRALGWMSVIRCMEMWRSLIPVYDD